jgi:hypothetical protein
VAKNNTTFRLKDVKELTYAAFRKITKDVWTKAEEHVVKIEKEYCKENCIDRSIILEPIIIDFCDDDSDDDTGCSIIILSIIDREKKKCKNRINVTLKPMLKIFGTCVCQFIKV